MSNIRIDDASGGARTTQNPAPDYVTEPGRPGRGYYREDPRMKSPALATLMSLMPGLGQIYIGYYGQGFLNIVVVASIITILSRGETPLTPFFALLLAFFWLYNVVDAFRRATLYNHALQGLGPTELSDFSIAENRGSLFWGVLLIIVGGVALSHTAFGYSLAWLDRWWPGVLVLIGLYLIYKSIETRRKEIEPAK